MFNIVMSHIGSGGEQNIIYKGVETFPWQMHFKAERSLKVKAQIGQYLLAVDLGHYKGTMCQPSCCSPKGVNTRQCASKAGPKRVDLVGSHISWINERVAARTLGLEGGVPVRKLGPKGVDFVPVRTLGQKGWIWWGPTSLG